MAIAWATVVFLVLLLPGFVFFAGLFSSSRFSRDAMPQNAVGQLAGLVLVSFSVHTVLVWIVGWLAPGLGARAVDFHVLLSAMQAGEAGMLPVDRLAESLVESWMRIVAYLATAVVLSFGLGRGIGWAAVKWQLRLFIQHEWLYQLDRPLVASRSGTGDRSGVIVKVFVLTNATHDGRQLGYEGYLQQFNIRPDGCFAYLLLRQPKKFILDIREDSLQTTSSEKIAVKAVSEAGKSSGIFLHVGGEEIRNVVFRQEAVVSYSKEDLAVLDRAVEERRSPPAAPEAPR